MVEHIRGDGGSGSSVGSDRGTTRSIAVLDAALAKLLSLHDGEQGVLDVIACGPRALAPLRALLFAREASGLYQPRCHVVDAVRRLGGYDILIEFLGSPRCTSDPIEAAGDAAVMNAATRAIAEHCDEDVFGLLLSLARRYGLTGPIEVLGAHGRTEALPSIIDALGDDVARPVAEDALRQFGATAVPALLEQVGRRASCGQAESESNRRRRRSALALLMELGAARQIAASIRQDLLAEEDVGLLLLGCRVALEHGAEHERQFAVGRLLERLLSADSLLRKEIEDILVVNGDIAEPTIDRTLKGSALWPQQDYSAREEVIRNLRRTKERIMGSRTVV